MPSSSGRSKRRTERRWVTRRRVLIGLAVIAAVALALALLAPEPPVHEVLPALAADDPAFAKTLEGHLSTPVVDGNKVDLLFNGDEIFPAKLAAVRGARTSITVAEYFWAEGAVAKDLAEALAERCRAGVRVAVLVDGVGALTMPDDHLQTMKRAGCRVETFRPLKHWTLRRHNYRNHRRHLVVDGQVGITGGSGVSEKWTGDGRREGHWRDTDVRIEGPAVAWLQASFVESWREATHELLGGPAYFPPSIRSAGDVRMQVVRGSPYGGSYAAYTMVLLALASARRSILIANPYFVLDERMMDAVLTAARRGVRVVALTPGKIDHNLVRSASRRDYGRLLQGGVEIFEYQAALLHAKTLVVDATWTTIGSTNLDNRSFAFNEELNVAVYDRAIARRMQEAFEADLRYARRIIYADWQARSLKERLMEWAVLPARDLL